jgi:transmembrane sensor
MSEDRILEEAAGWFVQQQGDAMDWEGFTAWLEADPRHRSAYDEIALLDARLGDYAKALAREGDATAPIAANDKEPARWQRWAGWGGGAIVAGLALTIAFQPAVRQRLPAKDYEAPAGKTVEVALDGAKVTLAPESRLTVRGQQLALEGTGYFDVRHQPGRTLTISAGDLRVTDIGTRFSIENEDGAVGVEVEEGRLSVASDRLQAPITLAAGHGVRADRATGTVTMVKVNPRQVAGWRTGKLQFDQVPLALVARDISRYSGKRVTVDAAIAGQPFSGVIAIDDSDAPARSLAQILSLEVTTADGVTRLRPPHR